MSATRSPRNATKAQVMRVATVDGKDEADAAGIAWAGRAMVASGRWDEAA